MANTNDASFTIPRRETRRRLPITSARARETMHVKVGSPDSVRHRLMQDQTTTVGGVAIPISVAMTACEVALEGKYWAQLDPGAVVDIKPCERCFLPIEVRRFVQQVEDERAREHKNHERWMAEREEHSRELEADRKRRQIEYDRRFHGEAPKDDDK